MAASLGAGVALIVCGVGFTAWGWMAATDFRGVTTKLTRATQVLMWAPNWSITHNSWRKRTPSSRQGSVGFYRAIGGVFAVAGPIMFIVGVVNVILS